MNPAFVYRQHGRSIFWIAFMSALAIHLGAVALAKTKSPSIKLQDVSPLPDVEVVDTAEPEAALLEESAPPPPLEQIHPDQDRFQEENLTPPPIRAHRKARPPSLIGGTTASLRSVKAKVAYAPRPVYPYEARRCAEISRRFPEQRLSPVLYRQLYVERIEEAEFRIDAQSLRIPPLSLFCRFASDLMSFRRAQRITHPPTVNANTKRP
jgi:hypothetical protein